MALISGITNDDGRDAAATATDLHPPDPENKSKNAANGDPSAPAPTSSIVLSAPAPASASDPKKPVGVASTKSAAVAVADPRITKAAATTAKPRRPPLSPTAAAAARRSRNLLQSLGLKKMSTTSGSVGTSQQQCPMSQASDVQSDSLSLSGSPQPESLNDSESMPIEIDDDNGSEEKPLARSKRRRTSDVWKDFTEVEIGGVVRAKCNYCSKKLSALSKNGTNHLRLHLNSCVQKKIKLNGKTMAQASLRFGKTDIGTVSVENYTFDQDIARKELGSMIVLHEYPLSMVDHVGFRRFVGALQPLFKIGTRNTIRSDIMAQYEFERKKAIEYMAGIQSRMAITTDLWTSDNQKRGYMAITAHFIDESWTLRNIIMRFIYVPAPHTAEVFGEELYESLVDWNLDEKISAITLDNCTTNDAVIPFLVRNIGKHKLLADGKLLHMRCSSHILNLVVKDGLEDLKPAIENIRDSIAYWTATPKRIEKFEEIAKFLKIEIKKKIGLDCKTRWNSTFIMLSTALPYKAVFIRASRVDKQYTCLPSDEEWKFAEDVVERLRLFFDITELFSGTDYVTANIYFTKIAEIRKKIRQWSTCGNPLVEAMSANMVTKFDKYWTDIQGLMGIATLLDPRFKTTVLQICYEDLLGLPGTACEDKVCEVKDLLADLMHEYHVEEVVEGTQTSAPDLNNTDDYLASISARVASRRPASMGFKSELDRYLDEEMLSMNTKKFNVLDWWKVAGTRYPTLRMIARDIYAIPITTVASESAFSTGGRVLSEHRSRLTSKMLEALMCSQDWIRNKYKFDEKSKKPSTFWSCLQDIQEGLQELAI